MTTHDVPCIPLFYALGVDEQLTNHISLKKGLDVV